MSKLRHEDILPVCDERFITKDRLLKAAWAVGIVLVGGIFGIGTTAFKHLESVDNKTYSKIETIEQRIPDVSAKMDRIISQNDELLKISKLNRIRSGIENHNER